MNENAFKIFISYANTNFELANRIFWILYHLQLRPWSYKHYPEPGVLIIDRIKNALKECEVMVVLLTRNGISSPWVNQEIGGFEIQEKRIIPLIESDIHKENREKLGFVQFKDPILLDLYNPIEAIGSLMRAILILFNPREITLECPKCGNEDVYQLPPINEIIGASRNLECTCTSCQNTVYINPNTLESVIKHGDMLY